MIDLYYNGNPLVSIILTTFNRSDYLKRAMDSFCRQSFKNAELIVVDDGSNDYSYALVDDFVKQHANIRYMKHSNRKTSLSKNVGLMAAAGDFIGFLDSDDEYLPDFIEKRIQYLQDHADVDLIEGGAIIIGDEFVPDKKDTTRLIHLSQCHIGSTFFGKKSVFFKLGGLDKHAGYAADSDFWERAEKFFRTATVDFPGYIYHRDTPGSICNASYIKSKKDSPGN